MTRLGSRRWWARLGALAAGGAAVLVSWTPAAADAPQKYGWWSAANAGAVAPPAPPEVPAHGLYVANGGQPTAISALSFQLSKDAPAGKLTLRVAGNPVITSGPTACPVKAKSAGYKAEENGAWSDRPSYDCANKVTGKVSSDKKSVTFDVSSLASSSTLAVVILAGGAADHIAFEAPGPDTLSAGGGGSSLTVGAPTSPSGSSGGPAGAFGGASTGGGGAAGPTGGSLPGAAALSTAPGGSAPLPPQVSSTGGDTGQAPAVAPPSGRSAAAPRAARTAASSPHGKRVASAIGLAAMVLILLAYAEGFGVLGGRMVPLSARRKASAA